MKPFHQQLKARREALGFSGRATAIKIGITQPAYWRYESGDEHPNRAMLAKIAKVLNCEFVIDAKGTRLVPNEPSAAG